MANPGRTPNPIRPERYHPDDRRHRKERHADQDDPEGGNGKPHIPAPLQTVRMVMGMAVRLTVVNRLSIVWWPVVIG